ncbi:MAG: hypothetical protein H0W86_11935 [Armatimonadetes bacterium]|nr:hypothetical protein [Armatimonadota bacterium]
MSTSTATTSDWMTTVVVTSNPDRFIGPNLELRSRVAYKAQGPVFVYLKWTVTD